jgi:hypothetical protein
MVGGDFVRNPGDVAELPDDEAKRIIDAGFAVPAKRSDKIETATLPQADHETATAPAASAK